MADAGPLTSSEKLLERKRRYSADFGTCRISRASPSTGELGSISAATVSGASKVKSTVSGATIGCAQHPHRTQLGGQEESAESESSTMVHGSGKTRLAMPEKLTDIMKTNNSRLARRTNLYTTRLRGRLSQPRPLGASACLEVLGKLTG
jgi:hypothetical protein